MPIIYRNDGAWGSGKGSRLTSLEVDENFYDHDQRIDDLENGDGPVEIDFIEADGSTLTIHLTDGSTAGPFPLPQAAFKSVGPWTNDTPYHYLDLVTVPRLGLYLVLQDLVTPALPAEFDPDVENSEGPFYQLVAPLRDADYDIPFSIMGSIPSDGLPLAQMVFVRAARLTAPLAAAQAYLGVAIADPDVSQLTFTLEKNGDVIGTVTFLFGEEDSAGGQVGTVTFPATIDFVAGDRLVLRAPDVDTSTDGELTSAFDLSVTLPAVRMDI